MQVCELNIERVQPESVLPRLGKLLLNKLQLPTKVRSRNIVLPGASPLDDQLVIGIDEGTSAHRVGAPSISCLRDLPRALVACRRLIGLLEPAERIPLESPKRGFVPAEAIPIGRILNQLQALARQPVHSQRIGPFLPQSVNLPQLPAGNVGVPARGVGGLLLQQHLKVRDCLPAVLHAFPGLLDHGAYLSQLAQADGQIVSSTRKSSTQLLLSPSSLLPEAAVQVGNLLRPKQKVGEHALLAAKDRQAFVRPVFTVAFVQDITELPLPRNRFRNRTPDTFAGAVQGTQLAHRLLKASFRRLRDQRNRPLIVNFHVDAIEVRKPDEKGMLHVICGRTGRKPPQLPHRAVVWQSSFRGVDPTGNPAIQLSEPLGLLVAQLAHHDRKNRLVGILRGGILVVQHVVGTLQEPGSDDQRKEVAHVERLADAFVEVLPWHKEFVIPEGDVTKALAAVNHAHQLRGIRTVALAVAEKDESVKRVAYLLRHIVTDENLGEVGGKFLLKRKCRTVGVVGHEVLQVAEAPRIGQRRLLLHQQG